MKEKIKVAINYLSVNDVIFIHERLTDDAAQSSDPISPSGIKSEDGLHSAVSRQESGFGGNLKYPDAISNAATLCYGVCLNHPFHNGNKRAALVSLLCHLDKNDITFSSKVSQDDLYNFMLRIADHSILTKKEKSKIKGDISDHEVKAISLWLKRKTRKFNKSERSISYNELEQVLRGFNIYFENRDGNYVDLVLRDTVEREVKVGLFKKKKMIVEDVCEKLANIPYFPGTGRSVGKNLVKSIRKQCNLTCEFGVDSEVFYGKETSPDFYISSYRKVLSRLAKT